MFRRNASLGSAGCSSCLAPVLDVLTDRQERVLELTAEGLAIKEIAGRMGCSERTVKNLRDQALQRLDAPSTVRAVAIYVKARKWGHPKPTKVRGQIGLDLA